MKKNRRPAVPAFVLYTLAALAYCLSAFGQANGDASLDYRAPDTAPVTALASLATEAAPGTESLINAVQQRSRSMVIEIPSERTGQEAVLNNVFFGTKLARQRQDYRDARKALDDGAFDRFATLMAALEDYPLAGYLAYLHMARQGNLDSASIAAFSEQHNDTRLTRKLQYQQLRQLAQRQQWQAFIEHYDTKTTNVNLRCHYARALFNTGEQVAAFELTRELWLTPSSMPDTCDPAFRQFIDAQDDIAELAWQRFDGAYRAGEVTLARYLARFLVEQRKAKAEQLLSAYADVAALPRSWRSRLALIESSFEDIAARRQVLALWIKRLARQDSEAAAKLVGRKLVRTSSTGLPYEQARLLLEELQPYIMTRYALTDYNRLPTIYRKIGQPDDPKSQQWLLRAYIARADWKKIPAMIARLPEVERLSERWRYWDLRSRQLAGSLDEQGNAALAALAENASFYGFAAARHSGKHFRLQPEQYQLRADDLEVLASSAALRRAIEHFIHGETDQANSNWTTGLREVDNENWLGAAYLASSLGWHQQAILTAARADAWRHYAIRFPRIATDEFAEQALLYNQPPEWFYATARQESALASQARSSAGAIGLMQLLPSTAKAVARSLDMEFNKAQLYEANYSINLGSRYLDDLYRQFGNRALGSAAYNAGPHRVSAWLKNLQKPIPLDAWIETIRFSETRQYVQNVLSFGLIHSAIHLPESEPLSVGQNDGIASIARPWPVFSFLGELESIVRPYAQQVQAMQQGNST
ncbi:MAG: transglycosylase SLT domain-containing protein [Pseudomonadales bacterium]